MALYVYYFSSKNEVTEQKEEITNHPRHYANTNAYDYALCFVLRDLRFVLTLKLSSTLTPTITRILTPTHRAYAHTYAYTLTPTHTRALTLVLM